MNIKLFNSTKRWVNWWESRQIDWKAHYMNPNHPHRALIVDTLRLLPFQSIFEVGCGAGANLYAIGRGMEGKLVGGVDINADAIACAQKNFQGAMLKVGDAADMMMSDKSTDVILSDMYLIYLTPKKMRAQLGEFKRVARNFVVLCEFHSTSWWQRFAIKFKEGYNVYNWKQELEKNGFYDIQMYKIPKEGWPESTLQQKLGHIIVARVPKYYQ